MSSTVRFTPAELEAAVWRHVEPELAQDLGGTLATVADDPVWEFYPLGVRVSGRDAIRELYTRLIPAFGVLKGEDQPRPACFSDTTMIVEQTLSAPGSDGSTQYMPVIVAMEIAGDGRMKSERVYCSQQLADWFQDNVLGPDFLDLPGVSRI